MSTETPSIDVDTTKAEAELAKLADRLRSHSKCPDDHDVMKPVPNRADRRRAQRQQRRGGAA